VRDVDRYGRTVAEVACRTRTGPDAATYQQYIRCFFACGASASEPSFFRWPSANPVDPELIRYLKWERSGTPLELIKIQDGATYSR